MFGGWDMNKFGLLIDNNGNIKVGKYKYWKPPIMDRYTLDSVMRNHYEDSAHNWETWAYGQCWYAAYQPLPIDHVDIYAMRGEHLSWMELFQC